MKKMKKIFAMLIAMAMVLVMSASVLAAVSISVERDSTYAGTASDAGRAFTYKWIFRATLSGSNTTTGGGYDEDGTPGVASPSQAKGFAYYLDAKTDAAQVSQLGTWDAASKTWTKAQGNEWFELYLSADGSKYVVTWADGKGKDTDTAQAAAKWLADHYTPLASGDLTWNSRTKKWTAQGPNKGYYLLSSDTGDNLIAATGDIEIKEKNAYPPIDKTQGDEDKASQSDADRNVAIGDVLTYNAKVTIPATAKAGETIVVIDTPSQGLTYNEDVKVKTNEGNAGVAFNTPAKTGDQAWTATITVTEDSKGEDVIFEYTMTVNEEALADTDKENTFELKYGDNYTSLPEKVKFHTYFTGIEKVDGDEPDVKLEGVEFTLKEADKEFKVTKNNDGVYIPSEQGSATVVTDKDGLIRIRGLDDDKTYTLTETKTNDGYNMLPDPVELVLVEDTGEEFEATTEFSQIKNRKGAVLPATGGMGTTIFYIVGAVLVIGAGIVLVTRRRMNMR